MVNIIIRSTRVHWLVHSILFYSSLVDSVTLEWIFVKAIAFDMSYRFVDLRLTRVDKSDTCMWGWTIRSTVGRNKKKCVRYITSIKISFVFQSHKCAYEAKRVNNEKLLWQPPNISSKRETFEEFRSIHFRITRKSKCVYSVVHV